MGNGEWEIGEWEIGEWEIGNWMEVAWEGGLHFFIERK
jgi:hypothetical protein